MLTCWLIRAGRVGSQRGGVSPEIVSCATACSRGGRARATIRRRLPLLSHERDAGGHGAVHLPCRHTDEHGITRNRSRRSCARVVTLIENAGRAALAAPSLALTMMVNISYRRRTDGALRRSDSKQQTGGPAPCTAAAIQQCGRRPTCRQSRMVATARTEDIRGVSACKRRYRLKLRCADSDRSRW
jgi:hypothetical protein